MPAAYQIDSGIDLVSYSEIFALVDVNSFYASCDTAWRQDLAGRPMVVLFNNDDCVIACIASYVELKCNGAYDFINYVYFLKLVRKKIPRVQS